MGIQNKLNKSVDLLYINDKWADKEIREISPFQTATNNIKYLEVALTKEVKTGTTRFYDFEERN